VLAFVALGAWLDRARSRDWDAPLRVTVYPIAAAGDAGDYVASLAVEDFAAIPAFLREQAAAYRVPLEEPVQLRVSHAVRNRPPELDDRPGVLAAMLWSLRMRFWAARVAWNDPLPDPDIQIFALYHGSAGRAAVPDSVGLSKGLMALANLYAGASASGSNQVVLTHELLHTLGATDKYDRATGAPLLPVGLGDPERSPLFPQTTAEIMAGRIAVSTTAAVMPDSLESVVVGPFTAREIGWTR
jgi:hypothetical protein